MTEAFEYLERGHDCESKVVKSVGSPIAGDVILMKDCGHAWRYHHWLGWLRDVQRDVETSK